MQKRLIDLSKFLNAMHLVFVENSELEAVYLPK